MTISAIKQKVLDKQLLLQSKEIKFCKKCVVSNQRPRIIFDEEGVCSACRYAEYKRKHINWEKRERQLQELCDRYRRTDGHFDVVVPCSGGKDASYVAHQLKHKYGMHPLTITFAPFHYTEIGFENFYNFTKSGFINFLAHPSGPIHRKLARAGFEEVGDPFLPFIYGQYCFGLHIALRFGIHLIFYGENAEAEYGGDTTYNECEGLPLEEYAKLYWKGTTVDELVNYALEFKDYLNKEDVIESELTFYRPPPLKEIQQADIRMHWYSYYHNWIPQENYYYASEYTGFQPNPHRSEGTYSKYASLDDRTDGFHYYMGFIKFGIGRTTSDTGHEIRDGHITREEAVALVRKYDGEFPSKYFEEFLNYLDIREEHFWEVVDNFRQPHLWKKVNGEWKLLHQVS